MATPSYPVQIFTTYLLNGIQNAISWSPVTEDTEGNPLTVAAYKIYRTLYPNKLNLILWKTITTLGITGAVDTLAMDDLGASVCYFVSACIPGGTAATPLKLGLVNAGAVEIVGTVTTMGTSVSASSPAIALGAGTTLVLNINGDGARTITLDANVTGVAIAADIQAKVQALTSNIEFNQAAYNNFTATYSTVYTLTSGSIGEYSSVVVGIDGALSQEASNLG